tara:strand:- start:433 stop:591 length:159 start_codon:yes stop_codon:yes gene_type:complete
MVGDKAYTACEELFEAKAHCVINYSRVIVPKHSVVDKKHVGTDLAGLTEQFE